MRDGGPMAVAARQMCALVVLAALLLCSGCQSYAWLVLRENMLRPTPDLPAAEHPNPTTWPADRITVTWIGHSTVLIDFCGTMILTDPVLGKRLAPPELFGVNMGIRRISQLPLKPEELPPVEIVLLSHAHYDHWDMPSLRQFGRSQGRTVAIIPRHTADLVPAGVFGAVHELAWGETQTVGSLSITAVPVVHWGERGNDRTPRGFNGYLIQSRSRSIFFAGDSAYGYLVPSTQGLRATFDSSDWSMQSLDWAARVGADHVDLCILPIGASHFRDAHMSPEEVWSVFRQLHGNWLLPVHWRTFILTRQEDEPVFEPIERLRKSAGLEASRIICDEPGRSFILPR